MSASWSLIKDGVLLGRLVWIETDQPWFHCRFHAEQAFARWKPYFDRLSLYCDRDLTDSELRELEGEIEDFDALAIGLIDDATHEPVDLYLVYIREDDAWLRY